VNDAAGRPTEYHLPGAITSHCAYDPNGKLVKQANHKQCENSLCLINKRIYSRNKRDQIIRLEDDRRGNRKFVYDRNGQIFEDIHEGYRGFGHRFDPCGNPATLMPGTGWLAPAAIHWAITTSMHTIKRKTCHFPARQENLRTTDRHRGHLYSEAAHAHERTAIMSFKVIRATVPELAVQMVGGAHPTRPWMSRGGRCPPYAPVDVSWWALPPSGTVIAPYGTCA
jgi:YD repeat-containing protein